MWPRVGLPEPRPQACGQRDGSSGAWPAARQGLGQRLGGLAWGLAQGRAVPWLPQLPPASAAGGSRPHGTCSRGGLSSCSGGASPGLKLAAEAWPGAGSRAQVPAGRIGFLPPPPPSLPQAWQPPGRFPEPAGLPLPPAPQTALRAAAARLCPLAQLHVPAPSPGAEPRHASPLRVPQEGLRARGRHGGQHRCGCASSAIAGLGPNRLSPSSHGCPGVRASGWHSGPGHQAESVGCGLGWVGGCGHRSAGGTGGALGVLCQVPAAGCGAWQ